MIAMIGINGRCNGANAFVQYGDAFQVRANKRATMHISVLMTCLEIVDTYKRQDFATAAFLNT